MVRENEAVTTVITTHLNADFDTVASMAAAKKIYPDAILSFPGSPEQAVKGFLLQSAAYVLDIRRSREVDLSKVTRLVVVDCRSASRIGLFRELVGKPGVELHLYDHHPDTDADMKGDLEVVRHVGSTTTIFVDILRERGILITPDEATVMMLGIHEDTGSLSFSSTTPEDCFAAAHLLSCGASLETVRDVLTREMTAGQVNLLHDLLRSSKTYEVHGVEVVIAEASREEYVGDLSALVHKLRDMEAVAVLFVLCQMGDRLLLVARSRRPEVDVGAVLREFGGGGHSYAASASVRDMTPIEARNRLLSVLSEKAIPRRAVRDLMSVPARGVTAGDTMEEALVRLKRFGLKAAPVLRDGEVVGIVVRADAEKAVGHGLGNEPVSEYMVTDFETVAPADDVARVQEIVLGRGQRLVPVVCDGKLEGVVTRTGLLRFLNDLREVAPPSEGEEVDPGTHPTRRKPVMHLLREKLPVPVLDLLVLAGKTAERLGMKAFVVGGFVRDLFLRHGNLDIDLVVEGEGIPFAEELGRLLSARVHPHPKFGTAVVVLPDGFKIDVATARVEYYSEPAALPSVESSSLKQDLFRRDFTINTLAVSLEPARFGEMIDFFGARQDLKERHLRVLHALSFVDDPTRILRALRFESRFGFTIARHTIHLIKNALRLDLVGKLLKPRLFGELELILEEKDPVGVFRRLAENGLAPSIHPSILSEPSHLRRFGDAMEVMAWFDLLYLDVTVSRPGVLFLVLLAPLADDEAVRFTDELGATHDFREWMRCARRDGEAAVKSLMETNVVSKKGMYYALRNLPVEVILYIMSDAKHPEMKRYISMYFTQLFGVRPILGGGDLKALGLRPGPSFRKVFDMILERKFAGELGTREEEEAFVRTLDPSVL